MISEILSKYEMPPSHSTPLGNAGGFSGSAIWRLDSADKAESWCLKRWPQNKVSAERIDWIHKVLLFARANGCPEIICPITTKTGTSLIAQDDCFWELLPWAKGTADFSTNPNTQKLTSAIDSLARFHHATARYHLNFMPSKNGTIVFGALQEISQSINKINHVIEREQEFCSSQDWESFKTLAPKFASDIAQFLVPLISKPMPVQPVIRDAQADHFFFADDRVCSIIDFGAMQVDTVAFDLARMLSSMVGDDTQTLQHQIDNYSALRQLSDSERNLIIPLMNAGILLGIVNWLTWVFVDDRKFDSSITVQERIRNLFGRFRKLI